MSAMAYTEEKHDRYEYATHRMFQEIFESIDSSERGRLFRISTMKELRNNWGVDFNERGFRVSDFNRLGIMLPDDSQFNNARELLNDSGEIQRVIAQARSEFDTMVANDVYPVMLLDPDLQNKAGVSDIRTFNAFTIGESLRSIPANESRSIYKLDASPIHQSRQGLPHNPNVYLPRYREAYDRLVANDWVVPEEPRPATESSAPVGQGTTVEMFGWSGNEDEKLPGLADMMGAYFTESDQEKLRKHFDGNQLEIQERHVDFLENSVAVLQYLRSNGIDFEVNDFYTDGQIDVRLSGMDASIRVFDLDESNPGQYIGRYYNSKGYAHVASNRIGPQGQNIFQAYTPEESLLPLQYMLGHVDGDLEKTASTPNSRVRNVDGLDGHIYIHRMPNRYDSIQFKDDAEAREYLDFVISNVDSYFESEFNMDQLKEILENPDDYEIEEVLSHDEKIREKQEAFIEEYPIVMDMVGTPFVDDIRAVITSFELDDDFDLWSVGDSPDEVEEFMYQQIRATMVGDYENGFNASYVMEKAPQHDVRTHSRNGIKSALKYLDYDMSKLKGNDFATKNLKDDLIKFNPDTALGIDDVDDPFIKDAMLRIQENLVEMGVIGLDKQNAPDVLVDDQGIMKWEGHRSIHKAANSRKPRYNTEDLPNGQRIEKLAISGEIGQIVSPNEHGIIKTKFASGVNYGFVPGYTGFFEFDGEYADDRMERFRVKGFEQHMNERIDALLRDQVSRPLKDSWDNIPDDFDASNLNRLYHGDVYGRRIELDFIEKSKLKPEVNEAIITSLSNRVRFGNEYGDYATTNAESQSKWDSAHEDQAAFSYWKTVGETNMRVLNDDLANIADLTMTGNARTQGLTWYLVDGARVRDDGSIQPSAGIMNLDGTIEPDKSAIRKLDFFKHEKYNAWDRVQMSANQLMTAEHVDENVGTALMTFGGWNYEDSFAVSKEFAERNQIQGEHPNHESKVMLNELVKNMISKDGVSKSEFLKDSSMNWSEDVVSDGVELMMNVIREKDNYDRDVVEQVRNDYLEFLDEHGTFRPLRRGDKLSDFGGNKGTIGIIIDREMDLEEAKKVDLEREVAIFKANPKLDVVGAPYSPLSRFNAGIVRELQDGEVSDIIDPLGNNGKGHVIEGALGQLNFIVTDLTVDEKTRAYTEEDVAEGGGRLASGQLAWALQSHDAKEMLTDIYGYNDNSWAALREYMIVTGLDMGPDGKLKTGYEPHSEDEIRNQLSYRDFENSDDFLNEISSTGGFLEVPFEMEFITGEKTTNVPVLSASLRKDTQLIDGTMRASDYNNYYRHMFDHVSEYSVQVDKGVLETPEDEAKRQESILESKQKAQEAFRNIQVDIKEKQFDGGHNGKHSFIRDKVMGVRMKHSATGVAISDPRLSVNDVSMDSEMTEALDVKQGDHLPLWRDPVWRKSAISAQKVLVDDGVHGFGVNPVTMGPKDGDLDGDTLGSFKLNSHSANKELVEKLSFHKNLIDGGTSDERSYVAMDQDFASARAVAKENGDDRLEDLLENIDKNARSKDERMQKKAIRQYDEYVKIAFRELGYGSDHINLNSRETVKESLNQMVDRRAKGSPGKFEEVMDYYDGKKGRDSAKSIQYAKGVQTDDTGLGGAVSQKLVSAMRNSGIDPALEVSYPVTQSILQIKHDDKQAIKINDYLRKEIPNLYKGHSSDGKTKNMTKSRWVNDYHDILTNPDKLDVDVSIELVEQVADIMVGDKGNVVRDINEVIKEDASPMDQIAYGGGWDRAHQLAKTGEHSLLDGKMNELFAPLKMRDYGRNPDLILTRSDVRDVKAETKQKETRANIEQSVSSELNKQLDSHFQPKDSKKSTVKSIQSQSTDDGLEL